MPSLSIIMSPGGMTMVVTEESNQQLQKDPEQSAALWLDLKIVIVEPLTGMPLYCC